MLGHWYPHNTIISVLGCHSRMSHDGVVVINVHICACHMLLYVYYPSSHWGTYTPNQLSPTTKALPLSTWTHNFGLGSSSISQRTQWSLSGLIQHDCPHLGVEAVKERKWKPASSLPQPVYHLNVTANIWTVLKLFILEVPRAHAHADVAHALGGIFAAALVAPFPGDRLFQPELLCRRSCQSPEWECSREASHICSPSGDKILKRTQSLLPMLLSDL